MEYTNAIMADLECQAAKNLATKGWCKPYLNSKDNMWHSAPHPYKVGFITAQTESHVNEQLDCIYNASVKRFSKLYGSIVWC
jgi:hypothetical protein